MKKCVFVQFLASIALILCIAACKATPQARPAEKAAPAGPRDGIRAGIITFGPHAKDITNGSHI